VLVCTRRYFSDVGFKEPVGIGARQHNAGDTVIHACIERLEIHRTLAVGRNLDDTKAGHRSTRRIGTVCRIGNEHRVLVGVAFVAVIGRYDKGPGQFAVRAGDGLQATGGHASDLREQAFQVINER